MDGSQPLPATNTIAAKPAEAVLGECRPQEALARLEGMVDVYMDIVTSFLNDEAGLLPKLRTSLAAGDVKSVQHHAHALKGLAAMCGAVALTAAASTLERAQAEAVCLRGAEMLERIEREFAAAGRGLAAYRHPH